jgi:hypothetical protein
MDRLNAIKSLLGRLSGATLIVIYIAALLVGLKLFDLFAVGSSLGTDRQTLPGLDLDAAQRTARTLELFPYEGWHMQANARVPCAGCAGEFRLGSMGFAIDFDVLSPPEKQADEYRIILIGGSGAHGWGASSTETTMARLLEGLLNARHDGRTYRVINLAMGSSVTYQNFIALNRWAHPLKPDLILSYSGVNDYTVPLHHAEMRDAHYYFNQLNSLAMAARASEMPPRLSWLAWFLPNLMTKTTIGYGIKYALFPSYFLERAQQSYDRSYGKRYTDPNKFIDELVTPNYIHAMQSIRRDFDGVPILIIWQASHDSEFKFQLSWVGKLGYVPKLREDFYDRMYQQVASRLSGPGWHVANFHAYNRKMPSPEITVHPTDKGQKLLAQYVLQKLDCVFAGTSPACLAD